MAKIAFGPFSLLIAGYLLGSFSGVLPEGEAMSNGKRAATWVDQLFFATIFLIGAPVIITTIVCLGKQSNAKLAVRLQELEASCGVKATATMHMSKQARLEFTAIEAMSVKV